jgi:hypothetical protein
VIRLAPRLGGVWRGVSSRTGCEVVATQALSGVAGCADAAAKAVSDIIRAKAKGRMSLSWIGRRPEIARLQGENATLSPTLPLAIEPRFTFRGLTLWRYSKRSAGKCDHEPRRWAVGHSSMSLPLDSTFWFSS